MGWIHHHRRQGAWLALAALAVQIVLSFGHVHLRVTPAAHASIAAPLANAVARASHQQPARNPDDDDYCAVCASIFLVSTSLVSTPPPLPVADAFTRIRDFIAVDRGLAVQRRAAFRSRAPPSV